MVINLLPWLQQLGMCLYNVLLGRCLYNVLLGMCLYNVLLGMCLYNVLLGRCLYNVLLNVSTCSGECCCCPGHCCCELRAGTTRGSDLPYRSHEMMHPATH